MKSLEPDRTPITCPSCEASLDPETLAARDTDDCPFCGTDLSDLLAVLAGEGTATFSRPSPSAAVGLPAGSRIELIESSDRRVVIYIPPGGQRSRGIGVFVLVWNGFMGVFTAVAVSNNAPGVGMIPLLLFLSLFWLVGLAILAWWVRLRFTRFYLLLDCDESARSSRSAEGGASSQSHIQATSSLNRTFRAPIEAGRFVVQRILFGRKSMSETACDATSRAELVEAYKQNNQPVYAVAVEGTDRTEKFGTALSREEKDWLVRTINEFLGVTERVTAFDSLAMPQRCDACGADFPDDYEPTTEGDIICPACGKTNSISEAVEKMEKSRFLSETFPDVAPDALPPESTVAVLDDSPERLRLRLPLLSRGKLRSTAGGFLGCFAVAWLLVSAGWLTVVVTEFGGGLFGKQGGVAWTVVLVAGVAMVIGLPPLLLVAFVLRGTITIDVGREVIACRWHLGRLGFRKRLPTAAVRGVDVRGVASFTGRTASGGSRPSRSSGPVGCVVRGAGRMIPLTTLHDARTVRTVAGLVRHRLHRLGHRLDDD